MFFKSRKKTIPLDQKTRDVCEFFIYKYAKAAKYLSAHQLMKLVYTSHGWHLEQTQTPLIHTRIETWSVGPVMPHIYEIYKNLGEGKIPHISSPPVFSSSTQTLLTDIFDIYSPLYASQFSSHISGENSPASNLRKWFGLYTPIPNDLIREQFEKKRALSQKKGT
jgi:uncharacterized phage-associated protein